MQFTDNIETFTGKSDIYKKFCPAYSKDLIDYLYSSVGFTQNSVVADIGAGTGILSRLLMERGSKVYAIEPNDDMRQTAERDLAKYENFMPINATAENTGLNEKIIDFVTLAAVFHLLDRQLFKKECQRILKFGGKVVLVWNVYLAFSWNVNDQELSMTKKYFNIFKKHDIKIRFAQGKDLTDFFNNSVYEKMTFNNDLFLDRESFIGMHLVNSYSPNKENEPEKYRDFVSDFNEFFDEYNINGTLCLPTLTHSYVGEV